MCGCVGGGGGGEWGGSGGVGGVSAWLLCPSDGYMPFSLAAPPTVLLLLLLLRDVYSPLHCTAGNCRTAADNHGLHRGGYRQVQSGTTVRARGLCKDAAVTWPLCRVPGCR